MYKSKKTQNSKLKTQNLEKGISIYLVILISSFILAVALGLSTILVLRIKVSREIGYSVVAFYLADTGIERVLYAIRKEDYNCSSPPCTVYSNVPLGGGSYTVSVSSTSPTIINSIGLYHAIKRAIEINY